jgi:hypothetical protein
MVRKKLSKEESRAKKMQTLAKVKLKGRMEIKVKPVAKIAKLVRQETKAKVGKKVEKITRQVLKKGVKGKGMLKKGV